MTTALHLPPQSSLPTATANEEERIPRCRQLGPPALLYRNKGAYTDRVNADVNYDIDDGRSYIRRYTRTRYRWYRPEVGARTLICREEMDKYGGGKYSCGWKRNPDSDSVPSEYTEKIRENRRIMLLSAPNHQECYTYGQEDKMLNIWELDERTYVDPPAVREKRKPSARVFSEKRILRGIKTDRERRYFTDPAYLALPDQYLIDSIYDEELSRQRNRGSSNVISPDDPNSPGKFGNCLHSFPCTCTRCQQQPNTATQCLVHPIGPLLDTLTISAIQFPGGLRIDHRNLAVQESIATRQHFHRTLEFDDTVRQVEQCGENHLFVRTDCSCFLLKIILLQSDPDDSTLCTALLHALQVVAKIDKRSMDPCVSSFLPVDTCCHSRYGEGVYASHKLAILSIDRQNITNTIHHSLIGDVHQIHEHRIQNLQHVNLIDYSSLHPMVLWSAARSFVQPTISHDSKGSRGVKSRYGDGFSLYSIDLRTNTGTFQWSPSSEISCIEGAASLSGILSDPFRDVALYVTSDSAHKCWELDCRMPCRSVASWSLPFAQEYFQNTTTNPRRLLKMLPFEIGMEKFFLLSVSNNTNVAGIHLYGRDLGEKSFDAQSIEVCAPQNLTQSDARNSMRLTLPDHGETSFVTGVAAVAIHSSQLEPQRRDIVHDPIRPDTLCVITSTNIGDLHCHNITEDCIVRNDPGKQSSVEKAHILQLVSSSMFPRRSDSFVRGHVEEKDLFKDDSLSDSDGCLTRPTLVSPFQFRKTGRLSIASTGSDEVETHFAASGMEARRLHPLDAFSTSSLNHNGIDDKNQTDVSLSMITEMMDYWDESDDDIEKDSTQVVRI